MNERQKGRAVIIGLDMYLKGRKYVSGYEFDKEQKKDFLKLVELAGLKEPPCLDTPSGYIELTMAYWRKANAIHKWFVDNCQKGVDKCQTTYVERETLQELLDLCKEVEADPKRSPELLPTKSGFFFGDTEYDAYYMDDIKLTISQLEKVLAMDNNWGICLQIVMVVKGWK